MKIYTKVAIVLAIAAVVFACFRFVGADSGYQLRVVFPHASGIRPGASVTYQGLEIGTVAEVSSYKTDGPYAIDGMAIDLILDPAVQVSHRQIPGIIENQSCITFRPANDAQLRRIFGPDAEEIIASPYTDGEFLGYGVVHDAN